MQENTLIASDFRFSINLPEDAPSCEPAARRSERDAAYHYFVWRI